MSDSFGSSLRAKIAAGLATTLLVLVVGGASYFAVRRSTHAAELVAHTDSVLIEREKLLSALKDLETGSRGFVLTAQPEFLEPFNNAQPKVGQSLAKLRALTADNRTQQARLDTLESVGSDAIKLSAQLVKYRREGGYETARALISTGQSKMVMDHASSILTDMETTEQALLAERTKLQRETRARAVAVIAIGSVIAFLLSLLVNRGIRQDVIAEAGQKDVIERQASQLKKQAAALERQLRESRALSSQLSQTNDHLQAASLATGEARAKAEEALRHASEAERAQAKLAKQNAAVLSSTLDSIIAMDANARITEFNRAAEEAFGYKREEVIGRLLEEIIIPHRYREGHRGGLERYLETGEAHVIGKRLELPAMRSDGSEFLAEVSITRADIEGAPAFTGVVRDITELKKAESEREKLIKALAKSNEELDQFAYVASHDLKAPLRG
ncbi:MAG: CHASE3 domain-containing protein, partial [Gemmatimonadales bacterium]